MKWFESIILNSIVNRENFLRWKYSENQGQNIAKWMLTTFYKALTFKGLNLTADGIATKNLIHRFYFKLWKLFSLKTALKINVKDYKMREMNAYNSKRRISIEIINFRHRCHSNK